MTDADDPMGARPARAEPRGEFPDHPAPPEYPAGPLNGNTARRMARQRLEEWRAGRGGRL